MAIWDTLKTAIVGVGVGEATADALEPILNPAAQDAWSKNPYKALDLGQVAEQIAQGIVTQATGNGEASLSGYNTHRLAAVVQATLKAPGVSEGLRMLRRGAIQPADFTHILRKAMLEPQWDAALSSLQSERLDPAVIAVAIQRGIMRDPGFLPVSPPTSGGTVPAFPVSPLDPVAEAAAAGIDLQRLFVETAIVGNPLSLQQAASALFRGIIDDTDYARAVGEGNTRNEWGPTALEQARQIPTAHDFVELRLRGWTDDDGMNAGTARHGMSEADTQTLFLISGRPITPHQVLIGLLRGGVYNGPLDVIDPAFRKALQESNIRPEWYHLLWMGRFAFPPFFQTVNLLKQGSIDAATATHWLTVQAYDPDAIATVVANLSGSSSSGPSKLVSSAKTKLLTRLHNGYVTGKLTEAQTTDALAGAGYDQGTVSGLVDVWGQELAVAGLESSGQA